VIAETVTWLRYDAGLSAVRSFRTLLDRVAQGSLTVRESDEDLRRSTFATIEKFGDQRLSYADAVGAVIARERRVAAVFGLDHHFRIMGFALEP
jgi:predicted nucleic acid-binding protein